jgi:apolipoprotein N-acyltransferase
MNPRLMLSKAAGSSLAMKVLYFAILALILTGVLWVLPKYPEFEFIGQWLNNFIYFVAFYLAARWAGLLGVKG